MSTFNDRQIEAMFGGDYICDQCGGKMEFEDEWEDTLVCPACGYSTDVDHYGYSDEEYEALFPTKEEVLSYSDEEDEEYGGETYDEVYDELNRD